MEITFEKDYLRELFYDGEAKDMGNLGYLSFSLAMSALVKYDTNVIVNF